MTEQVAGELESVVARAGSPCQVLIAGDVLASLTTKQSSISKAWTGGVVMADASLNPG